MGSIELGAGHQVAGATMSTVSAIIVNWNGKHLLTECLDSLYRQTRLADEIFVVDNGSRDGSQAFIRERYPDVILIELEDNKGFSIANNIAIERATGDYLALLNNDLLITPEWINQMVSALDNDTSLGSCASKMLFYHQRDTLDSAGVQLSRGAIGSNRGHNKRDSAAFGRPTKVFGACAGAAMYRATMIQEIGAFDEDFYIYYEDLDLAIRAQLAGYDCLYVPQAVVYHHHSATGKTFSKKNYYLSRNYLLLVVKDMPTPLLARYFLRVLLQHVLFDLAFIREGKWRICADVLIDARRLLPRMLRKRREILGKARRSPGEIAKLLV